MKIKIEKQKIDILFLMFKGAKNYNLVIQVYIYIYSYYYVRILCLDSYLYYYN